MEMYSVIIVDLQKEFFSPEGILGDRYIPAYPLVHNIRTLVGHARKNNYPIYWVRSEYKKECCIQGSELVEFIPEVQELIIEDDHIITKRFYSAFLGTELNKLITTEHVLIAGVTANNCVRYTAMSAVDMKHYVTLVKDCISIASNNQVVDEEKLEYALRKIIFAKIITTQDLI